MKSPFADSSTKSYNQKMFGTIASNLRNLEESERDNKSSRDQIMDDRNTYGMEQESKLNITPKKTITEQVLVSDFFNV